MHKTKAMIGYRWTKYLPSSAAQLAVAALHLRHITPKHASTGDLSRRKTKKQKHGNLNDRQGNHYTAIRADRQLRPPIGFRRLSRILRLGDIMLEITPSRPPRRHTTSSINPTEIHFDVHGTCADGLPDLRRRLGLRKRLERME